MKKLATLLLVVLAVAGGVVAVMKTASPPESDTPSPTLAENADAIPENGVVVTYFTTDVRCPSCRKIEELTRQAVESHYGTDSERVVFRIVNTDKPANAHFVEEYELVSKTVIVSKRHGGKEAGWQNLQDVWLKLNDPAEFTQYVLGCVRASELPVTQ